MSDFKWEGRVDLGSPYKVNEPAQRDPLLPKCDDAKGKIESLERRLEHVQGQIDRKYFSERAGQWARAEAAALKHAISCMKYVKGLS